MGTNNYSRHGTSCLQEGQKPYHAYEQRDNDVVRRCMQGI